MGTVSCEIILPFVGDDMLDEDDGAGAVGIFTGIYWV